MDVRTAETEIMKILAAVDPHAAYRRFVPMKELQTLFGLPLSRTGRWAVEPCDFDEDTYTLAVRTPRGTGPGAYSQSVITKELMDDRRGLAHAIWDLRRNAIEWRRHAVTKGGSFP